MKVLFQKIISEFAGSGHGLASKLYLSEAPADVEPPYIVYNLISRLPEYWFGGERFEGVVVQFDIYTSDVSATNCTDYFEAFATFFDDYALDLTGYGCIQFERENAMLLRDADIGHWRYFVQYRGLFDG